MSCISGNNETEKLLTQKIVPIEIFNLLMQTSISQSYLCRSTLKTRILVTDYHCAKVLHLARKRKIKICNLQQGTLSVTQPMILNYKLLLGMQ